MNKRKKLREITKEKKTSFFKIPKEMAKDIKYECVLEGDDFKNELVTVRARLIYALERVNEDLNLTFTHELPLTWADHMRKAKGLPYKSEKVYFSKWFEVNYKKIFGNIKKEDGLESFGKPKY